MRRKEKEPPSPRPPAPTPPVPWRFDDWAAI